MSTEPHELTPDAQAIFLLCGRFGDDGKNSVKPLTRSQYNEVAKWLHNNDMRPAALLDKSGRKQLSIFGEEGKITESRIQELLDRGTALAMAVEEWTNKGGWILTRSDDDYPTRFRRRLKLLAPPLLYGIGDQSLLEFGGASMVGSRDSDEAALSFIRDLARRCADQGIAVVSGGARGVDQASMDAALEANGIVVGALANGLAKTARKKKYRNAIADERLTLVSAYHPDSRFQVWKAMNRNKHIYALSDGAVVAHSAHGSGGTWSGATENLKNGWVPLSVRAEPPVPKGNEKLIEKGGRPIDRRLLQDRVDLGEWLFTDATIDKIPSFVESSRDPAPGGDEGGETEKTNTMDPEAYLADSTPGEAEILPWVWPVLEAMLEDPLKGEDLREYFDDLRLCQAQDWLIMAAEQGLVAREENPVRYFLPTEEEKSNPTPPNKTDEADEPGGDGCSGTVVDSAKGNGQTAAEADLNAKHDGSQEDLFDEEAQ